MSNDSVVEPNTDAPPVDVPEKFAVADEKSANWVVRRIVESRRYRGRVAEWARHETARAEREEAYFIGRFGAELEAWLRRRFAETKSRQRSVNLPAGRLGLRWTSAKLVIEDESAATAWAQEHYSAAVSTVITTKLNRTVLREHLKTTGELPDRGVRLDPPCDRLVIR